VNPAFPFSPFPNGGGKLGREETLPIVPACPVQGARQTAFSRRGGGWPGDAPDSAQLLVALHGVHYSVWPVQRHLRNPPPRPCLTLAAWLPVPGAALTFWCHAWCEQMESAARWPTKAIIIVLGERSRASSPARPCQSSPDRGHARCSS